MISISGNSLCLLSAMDPVAQLGSLHDLPVFGWIASDPVLANKNKYTTLVRLLGPLTATGSILLPSSWPCFSFMGNYICDMCYAPLITH